MKTRIRPKVSKQDAEAMKCLGRKLEYAAADPDPMALDELTIEYNCINCEHLETCHKLFMAVAKKG